ncbi:hypothetical protein Tco_0670220 [Tanacetum coccineum]
MLGAARVQIPENNLDDLHSSREEDGTSETMDPQDLLEDNIGFVRTKFDDEALFVFVFPEDVTGSVNLTLLSLFFWVTTTNLSLGLLMLGQIHYYESNEQREIFLLENCRVFTSPSGTAWIRFNRWIRENEVDVVTATMYTGEGTDHTTSILTKLLIVGANLVGIKSKGHAAKLNVEAQILKDLEDLLHLI